MSGRVLVTGASGFLGRRLTATLAASGRDPRAAVRTAAPAPAFAAGLEAVTVGELDAATDWRAALAGVDSVVHLAARVHVMQDTVADPLAEFRRVNVAGTLNLARQAALAGVRRLVFVSSVKVNGEGTAPGRPYTADDVPAPQDAYGVSKHEAELGLQDIAKATGLEVTIIRPVLVYGPGVGANFLAMMRWLYRGVPLPLGAIDNRRSLLAVDNLVDLLLTCLDHPGAANQVFLASDGEDVSTTVLLRRTAQALGKPARLLPVPVPVLGLAARLLGKQDFAQRLCGSLQVDIGKTRDLLGWTPPLSLQAALALAAGDFLRRAEAG
ncbi:MAG: SDR family oxidoreductase [Polaromonas sp.]|nr:SDR family oxidoreductase [Polaromonas sp.]